MVKLRYGADTLPADNVLPSPSGPYPFYMAAYAASKTLALHATKEFQASQHPSFTIMNIMPSFVMGPNELTKELPSIVSGTNRMILGIVLGNKSTAPIFGLTVHVDDVAYMHVKALDHSIKGNQDFAANGDGIKGIVWEDALDSAHSRSEIRCQQIRGGARIQVQRIRGSSWGLSPVLCRSCGESKGWKSFKEVLHLDR